MALSSVEGFIEYCDQRGLRFIKANVDDGDLDIGTVLYVNVLDSYPLAVLVFDDNRVSCWNKNALRQYGLSEIFLSDGLVVLTAEELEKCREISMFNSRSTGNVTVNVVEPDSFERLFEAISNCISSPAGK